jgi:hypothetical protein
LFSEVAAAARAQLKAVDGLWGQLIPMTLLFFCMAFVNTLLDAVKARGRCGGGKPRRGGCCALPARRARPRAEFAAR